MTRGSLIKKCRENLNDWGITYYNVPDLEDSIQDAYDEIVIVSECIESIIDIPIIDIIPANGPWVNFHKLVPDYYRIIGILNRQSSRFLYAHHDRLQEDYIFDWQLRTTGTVEAYLINGIEWVAFPNSFSDPNFKDLRLWYKASAPQLISDADTFKILTEYQKLLEYYVSGDLLEQNQEYIKADKYWKMYEPLLEEYRKKILLLSKSDRIFTRGELIYGVNPA